MPTRDFLFTGLIVGCLYSFLQKKYLLAFGLWIFSFFVFQLKFVDKHKADIYTLFDFFQVELLFRYFLVWLLYGLIVLVGFILLIWVLFGGFPLPFGLVVGFMIVLALGGMLSIPIANLAESYVYRKLSSHHNAS